ncbi:MAG: tail fiber domain-containing protein, partial [Candidatus Moraniibacteriota bacterium]
GVSGVEGSLAISSGATFGSAYSTDTIADGDVAISGNVGIGTTSPTAPLTVYNGTTTGTYTTSGWASSSDARLKTNIIDVTNPLDKIKSLSGVYFNWNANPNSDRQIGLIAQDTLKVLPEVVVGNEKDGYGIAYGNLSVLLIEGVKAQQTQLSALTSILQNSNSIQDNEIQKLNQALASLTTTTTDQATLTNQKITSIQANLATTGSQINLLSSKLNSASNLLSQNSQPTQELPFYQFKTQSPELSSPFTDQTIENNQFAGTYNSPNNFQEINIQLHEENQLDLTEKDQAQTSLIYDVYIEDPTILEDFHTELGNQMDQKELEWNRPNHPNFIPGWNTIKLPLIDGIKSGEIDFQKLSYFRAYFKFQTNTNLKFKNIRIETKATYQPLAQTIDTQNLDLWNNTDQGAALKSIFGELDGMKTQDLAFLQVSTKLTNDLKAMQEQVVLLQDQTKAIIDFGLALNLGNVIYKDTLGNVDILEGKITAKDIEALSTVKAMDIEATNSLKGQNLELGGQVSGTNSIKAGQVESVSILTSQAKAGIKLYITPKGSTQGKSLYYDEGDIEPGIGFRVRIDAPALDKDIEFNWLIVK